MAQVLTMVNFFPLLLPSHILYDWLIYYVIAPKGQGSLFCAVLCLKLLEHLPGTYQGAINTCRMNWNSWVVVGTAYLNFSIKTLHAS